MKLKMHLKQLSPLEKETLFTIYNSCFVESASFKYMFRHQETGHKVMNQLLDSDFIAKKKNRRNIVWYVTKNGTQILRAETGRDVSYFNPERIKLSEFEHDVGVTNILGVIKQEERVTRCHTARALTTHYSKNRKDIEKNVRGAIRIPDGQFRIGDVNEYVSVEFELSLKSLKRYASIYTFYKRQANISHVIWVFDTNSVMEAVRKNLRYYLEKDYLDEADQDKLAGKHLFCFLDPILKDGTKTVFSTLLGKEARL